MLTSNNQKYICFFLLTPEIVLYNVNHNNKWSDYMYKLSVVKDGNVIDSVTCAYQQDALTMAKVFNGKYASNDNCRILSGEFNKVICRQTEAPGHAFATLFGWFAVAAIAIITVMQSLAYLP